MQDQQRGRPGRRPALSPEHVAVLRVIAQEQPRSSLDEVTRELFRRSGTKVNPVSVRKALREAGIERLKPTRRAGERAAQGKGAGVRTGYTAALRTPLGGQRLLLRAAHGLRLALAAQELPAVAGRLHVLQALGRGRHVRDHARSSSPAMARARG